MKRNIAWMLLTLSLLAMLAGTSIYAQSSSVVKVNIPFDFRVGSQSLPAGEYTVTLSNPSTVLIRSKEGHQSSAALTNDVQIKQNSSEGKLIFNRYGEYQFLSQIWTPREAVGRKLLGSNFEQKVAGRIPPSESTVLIAQNVNN